MVICFHWWHPRDAIAGLLWGMRATVIPVVRHRQSDVPSVRDLAENYNIEGNTPRLTCCMTGVMIQASASKTCRGGVDRASLSSRLRADSEM